MSSLLELALSCLRVGTFVFGGGPALVPLMRPDVVVRYGWLTSYQFNDAVALGQVTPGPLLVTATFIGWKVGFDAGGPWAAVLYATVATVCIFLPSFFMTIAASHQLGRLRGNPRVQQFTKGVEAGVVGLIAAAAVQMARDTIGSWPQGILCLAALTVLVRTKVEAAWVIGACGGLALLASFVGVW
ncbi:MAG: chromate transporter [Armatimonadetes bacterium]|nr:chromate transporter [Armatimonadota bacterium]